MRAPAAFAIALLSLCFFAASAPHLAWGQALSQMPSQTPSQAAPVNISPELRKALPAIVSFYGTSETLRAIHRLGKIVDTLPVRHETMELDGRTFYYFAGIFYEGAPRGYVIVPGPLRAIIKSLPKGAERVEVRGGEFFYSLGTFYRRHWDLGVYEVVAAPVGVVVSDIPRGFTVEETAAGKHFVAGGVWFRPYFRGTQVVYVVTKVE